MYNKLNGIVKALGYFTEIALTAMIPIGIWIFIAKLLQARLGLGSYVILIGIILGVLTAYVNLFKLFKRISADNSKRDNGTDKKE
ncbi:MAG: AtpZ/AtpI family protein [Clostridia bacterium]|nr:AtpZ/AtpI family protein [Clostridia bacterium]